MFNREMYKLIYFVKQMEKKLCKITVKINISVKPFSSIYEQNDIDLSIEWCREFEPIPLNMDDNKKKTLLFCVFFFF